MKARQLWVVLLGLLLLPPLGALAADDLVTSQLRDEARLWQSKDRDDLAADAWNRLLLGSPQHGEALVSMGLIMARSGDRVAAKEWYARASRLKSSPPDLAKLAAAVGLVQANEVSLASAPAVVVYESATEPRPVPQARTKPRAKAAAPQADTPKAKVKALPKLSTQPAPVVVATMPQAQAQTQVEPPGPPKPRPSKALPYFPPL
jgi:cellulose synthase operon protein C